jgi:chemotaxis protein histidine kinase CheA
MSGKHSPAESNVTSTTPDFALKKKLGPDVSIRDAFSEDVVASAESVIEESKQDFFGDAQDDITGMEESFAKAEEEPAEAKPHIRAIQQCVFSLKGQSETLGFDLLAHASKSLYDFCSRHFRAGEPEQLIVVRKHLDTIKLIVKEKMQGDGGQLGQELIKSLHLLTEKYK